MTSNLFNLRSCWSYLGVIVVLLVVDIAAVGQTRSQAQAEKDILKIEQDGLTATRNADTRFFERLLTSDWTAIGPFGEQTDRAGVLSGLKNTKGRMKSGELTGLSVRFLTDDVALLTGTLKLVVAGRQKTVSLTARFSEIFVWRDGRWMSTMTQSTPIRGS